MTPRPRARTAARTYTFVLTLFAALGCSIGVPARAADPEPLTAFPQSLLAIRTSSGQVLNFKIWLADTPAREEQGLMFVREMDDHAGMLFVFPAEHRLSMWMKNTVLSLDMLFIDSHGRINAIVPRTTPQSTAIIQPGDPARAVLELKGGVSKILGVQEGDIVLHNALNNVK